MPTSFSNFERCLAWAVNRWPEESWAMLGPAASSPEASVLARHPKSWAAKVFPDADATSDHREFDRAALGLLCMWTMWKEKSLSGLGAGDWPIWRETLVKTLSVTGGFEALVYAILFNDLGKLDSTVAALGAAGVDAPADHDEALAVALRVAPEAVAPGMSRLQKPWPAVWLAGLESGFNVGMAAQMELPRAGWRRWLALGEEERVFHALHSYFDVLGSGGAADPVAPAPAVASRHLAELLALACFGGGPDRFEAEVVARRAWDPTSRPALALACMARANAVDAPTRVQGLLDALPFEDHDALDWALGDDAMVAWQYAPALLAAGSGAGLSALLGEQGGEALAAFAQAVKALRPLAPQRKFGVDGSDVGVANLGEMARLRKAGDERWKAPGRWEDRRGGWAWLPA